MKNEVKIYRWKVGEYPFYSLWICYLTTFRFSIDDIKAEKLKAYIQKLRCS